MAIVGLRSVPESHRCHDLLSACNSLIFQGKEKLLLAELKA